MTQQLKRIAVLTSGGDAPGMNAAIRAVVRAATGDGIEVFGIEDGYCGMFHNKIKKLHHSCVSDIINRGGTFLGSARFEKFKDPEIRKQAMTNLTILGINGLIVIGGDGSYMGAKKLTEEFNIPCIGIPGTIDNDIAGTEFTIGYQTALNTVVDAIDRIRDTSNSHKRVSIIEIMGRYCGDLTLNSAVAGGCEFIVVPELAEKCLDLDTLIKNVNESFKKGKRHAILAITELMTDAHQLAKEIEKAVHYETRATILGHIQRGGAPCAFDRILASKLGVFAVELLQQGIGGRCVGIQNNRLVHHDIIEAINTMKRPFDNELYHIAQKIS